MNYGFVIIICLSHLFLFNTNVRITGIEKSLFNIFRVFAFSRLSLCDSH